MIPSVTLTIKPGTKILGERGAALVVRSGGLVRARGTREAPIVFTSAKPEGQRLAGDWGGVALLGKAPVNRDKAYLNIVTDQAEATFGGRDDSWDCGTLEYVRIEFGGGQVKGEEALNGLSLAGCGSDTTIDHLQTHFGADDGVEIFGGTVNLRHVVSSRNQDDGFDIDLGWKGNAQFLAVLQDAGGDNGIEVDNLAEDPTATPHTDFEIYNFTLIGSHDKGTTRGVTFKAGAAGFLSHGIMMGQTTEAVDVYGPEAGDQAMMGNIGLEHTLLFQIGPDGDHYFPVAGEEGETGDNGATDDDGGFEENVVFEAADTGNVLGEDPGIDGAYDLADPHFTPSPDHTTGQSVPAPPKGYDPTAVYLGAFSPNADPWTEDWTDFPKN